MVTGNAFKITEEVRQEMAKIFLQQYEVVVEKEQKLFDFGPGPFATIQNYENRVSFQDNNTIYSHDEKLVMSVFAITGRRLLKIEKLLGKQGLQVVGMRVPKETVVPMHIDPNKHSIGRENPIHFIVVSGSDDSKIYFSNRRDGSRQIAIPGLSQFIMYPTEIEHGAYSGNQDMDIVQIMVEGI